MSLRRNWGGRDLSKALSEVTVAVPVANPTTLMNPFADSLRFHLLVIP